MFEKQKRTINRKLLDSYQGKECLICRYEQTTVGHHIITKGAGGPDEEWNLVALCHIHHQQIHRLTTAHFAELHKVFHRFLIDGNWQYIKGKNRGRWIKPERA